MSGTEKGSSVWQLCWGPGRRAGAPLPRQHPTPPPLHHPPNQPAAPTRWTGRSGCPGCRCCRRSTCGAGRRGRGRAWSGGWWLGSGWEGSCATAAVRFKQAPALPTHTPPSLTSACWSRRCRGSCRGLQGGRGGEKVEACELPSHSHRALPCQLHLPLPACPASQAPSNPAPPTHSCPRCGRRQWHPGACTPRSGRTSCHSRR